MNNNLTWADFSDNDKKQCRALRPTFVMAPRELSATRLVDLVKQLLEKNHVIFGVAAERFVAGFEGQVQFQTLPINAIEPLAQKIAAAHLPHKLIVLSYPQIAVDDVIRAIRPKNVVLVRGSWHLVFQRRSTYDLLTRRNIPFSFVSPFVHDSEAKEYLASIEGHLPYEPNPLIGDRRAMLAAAQKVATASCDYSFQTGVVLAEPTDQGYRLVDAACNEVVPYQTYALHYGNSREEHLSEVHDANHYDTIHAEMNLLVRALKTGRNFEGKSLFINMMPCPSCARTLVKTGLAEVVYNKVHSDGYAVELFEHAGIKTRKADI